MLLTRVFGKDPLDTTTHLLYTDILFQETKYLLLKIIAWPINPVFSKKECRNIVMGKLYCKLGSLNTLHSEDKSIAVVSGNNSTVSTK